MEVFTKGQTRWNDPKTNKPFLIPSGTPAKVLTEAAFEQLSDLDKAWAMQCRKKREMDDSEGLIVILKGKLRFLPKKSYVFKGV